MRSKTSFSVFVLICLTAYSVRADTIPALHTGFQAHYGFIIPHSDAIEAVSHTNPYGFNLGFNKLNTSFNRWQVFNAYWISGLQAGYFNYQNPSVVGSAYELTLFAEPVVFHRKGFFFSIRGGTGLSYHTKIYDQYENPSNQFFSTRLAFPLFIDLRVKQRLAGNTFITLSGCYNHISNGGFKQPNKGMNFPTLALGLEYFISEVPVLDHNYSSSLTVPEPGISLVLQTLTAVKVLGGSDEYPEQKAFIYGLNIRGAKQLKTWYALNLGAELVIDGYIRELVEREQSESDHKRASVTVGQDFLLGKVAFSQLFGIYLYSPYEPRDPVYQKYELTYKFTPDFSAGIFLKAHRHVAEMMGLCFSYSFNW